MTKNLPSPCKSCPFTRAIKPGALGGSPPETFIGQAFGPFVLPCHQACDFDDPEWKLKAINTPQCAGAASFRASVGIAPLLPAQLHSLPPNAAVFSTPAEFIAHHKEITLEEASEQMKKRPVIQLLAEQMSRDNNINY